MAYTQHYEGAPYCGCDSCLAARVRERQRLATIPARGLMLALQAVVEATRERGLEAVPLAALEEMIATLEAIAKAKGA